MQFEEIKFPIEGNVQDFVHFNDTSRAYSFSFASPFRYTGPEEYKNKNAFLLGSFDPYRKQYLPDEVHLYYTIDEAKTAYPIKKAHVSVRKASFFTGQHEPIGNMDILLPSGFFRSYNGLYPNIIYNTTGEIMGFCHYQPDRGRKVVYSCSKAFEHLFEEIKPSQAREWENVGTLRCLYIYDLVHLESDARSKMEALFSPSKKAEMVNNRVSMIRKPENEEQARLALIALFAFFWSTYIDLPMVR